MHGKRIIISRPVCRMANFDDIQELANLRVLQQIDDWCSSDIDSEKLKEKTIKYLEDHLDSDLLIFVKVINGNIVATCGLQILNLLPQHNDNGKCGFICNVYTLPEYRRKGHQKDLFKIVIEYAKANCFDELKLESDSEIAIKLYKSCGFKKDNMTYIQEL